VPKFVADSSVSPTGLKWAVDPVADVVTTAGDLLYATAADTVTRLGIGTAGQVLAVDSGATAPEWVTPAGGGSMTLLSTTTFSGAAVNLTSISGAYKHLYLEWYGLTNATANAYLDMRLNNNTGSVYNNYRDGTSGTSVFQQGENADTIMRVSAGNTDRTSTNNSGVMIIYDYADATHFKNVSTKFGFKNPTNNSVHLTDTLFLSTTAVTQVNFFLDNGASFSSGTVKVYGVN
jgi:hypothetical protein